MNRSPLTPLVIPVGEPVKPKTPHRVNADKIRALTNEIIHLRNIVSRMAQRLSLVERQLHHHRPTYARVQKVSQTES
jgi:hypothetical protein